MNWDGLYDKLEHSEKTKEEKAAHRDGRRTRPWADKRKEKQAQYRVAAVSDLLKKEAKLRIKMTEAKDLLWNLRQAGNNAEEVEYLEKQKIPDYQKHVDLVVTLRHMKS